MDHLPADRREAGERQRGGLAIGWWLVGIGAVFGAIALVGWVFEFYRGEHAH